MEGQTTPIRQSQATPSTLFPSQSSDTILSSGVNKPMSALLADITSLMLLSASADQNNEYDVSGSPPSFLVDLEKTVVDRLKHADEYADIGQDLGTNAAHNMPIYRPMEGKPTMASDTKRSMEHLMLAMAAKPRPDLVSLQSAADCSITDRPLCMTFDSGISSPASALLPGNVETERSLKVDDSTVSKQLHQRLQRLKTFVEQRLQDSSHPRESATLSKEIRDRLCTLAKSSLTSSRSESPSAPELFMEKALSSSLLIFENTKLSAEVAYLQKKVEILEDIAATRGFNPEACKPTMETISIGSQTDEQIKQHSTFDETDFGISDFSLTSPETNCLMSTAFCKDGEFPQPSGMSTPGAASNKRQRRKIEVPTQLKVTPSTSYLSIDPWADVDDKQQNGSYTGCWRGLCACFYNSPQARHN
ncbi:uncharacterized protein LOC110979920 isoform X2 [Acanthaster planci]|uniref:Uncharacterized protein LOC110979920 isoform X2 n=1 Tax=Acanthaster planci TaxID=133434 RepID=A0A8B7YJP6_ACAPL|nr:uncharacterized protein LOC110979920 isoform X2 [Acanthaster planci]